ncbi:MAG: class I SAM-dependent methyltransferase [Chloroflexi bacterium]|nr:class I SAM-dependent methyltransferase [Chloroflexota bacterium]
MFSFPRYLAAKKSVDDRALNGHVWHKLWEELPASSRQRPLSILEIGAGTGSMIQRILDTHHLSHALYTAIDADPDNIAVLEGQLQGWAEARPHFIVMAQAIDLYDFLPRNQERYDLLIAHAVLDLLPLAETLPALLGLLQPNGLFYFTLNFDGVTAFQPPTPLGEAFDDEVERVYHRTMDERHTNGRRSGDSRTGRHLLPLLRQCGAEITAVGGSDWVVCPPYPHDEAYFLSHILHFFDQSLSHHPDLPADQFAQWLAARRAQLASGDLIYLAHQLDVLGKVAADNN